MALCVAGTKAKGAGAREREQERTQLQAHRVRWVVAMLSLPMHSGTRAREFSVLILFLGFIPNEPRNATPTRLCSRLHAGRRRRSSFRELFGSLGCSGGSGSGSRGAAVYWRNYITTIAIVILCGAQRGVHN